MKLFNKLLFLTVAAVAIWSCKKDETRTVIGTATQPALTASANDIVLQEANAANDAVTFSWTPSDWGYKAGVDYFLEIAPAGSNFANAKVVSLGSSREKKYTVAQLNTLANEMKLTAFASNNVEARVKAQVSPSYAPVYSNVVTFKVTPYLTEPPYATVYLVGDATENAWDNTKATPMFRDETDPFVYTWTGNLKAGYMKFLGYLGKWAPQWGADNGVLKFRETEAQPDPPSIQIATAGYYTVKLDLRNNEYSVTPYDASGAANYTSTPIGIIGAFNGWGSTADMANSALNPHIWDLTYTFADNTEMKFRWSTNWDKNWGPAEKNRPKLYGKGKQGGENIVVPAGTYRILFNDLSERYLLIKE